MMLGDVSAWATIVAGGGVVTAAVGWAVRKSWTILNVIEGRSRELEHNGGSSVKDAVRRSEKTLDELTALVFETRSEARESRMRIEVGYGDQETRLDRLQHEVATARTTADYVYKRLCEETESRLFRELELRAMLARQGITTPEPEGALKYGEISEGSVEPVSE